MWKALGSENATWIDLRIFTIPCIIGDCKADCDTYNNHSIGVDGGVSEFIVQTSALNSTAQGWGDCSYCEDSWNSNVIEIRLYDVDLL